MHDYEMHLEAVDKDLEYYRAKRLEPLFFQYVRRGYVSLFDFGRGFPSSRLQDGLSSSKKRGRNLEHRIRNLEDELDEFVRGIAMITPVLGVAKGVDLVVEDLRKERGDYDEFFRVTKKKRKGDLLTKLRSVENALHESQRVLRALTDVLINAGFVYKGALRKAIDPSTYPSVASGARAVAKAWADTDFKKRLLSNPRETARELMIPPGRLGALKVVEDTERIKNVIVCTLCSCYPYDLLGNPPWWYKDESYRDGIIRDPRSALHEMFGVEVPTDVEIRVHDSTSDFRYMVLPRRPNGTEGLSEEELARLVSRESLIGVGEQHLGSKRRP